MTGIILTIIVATLPVCALLYYFWHRDKGEKEPMHLMRKVFWGGVFVTIPVAIVEMLIDGGVVALFDGQVPLAYWFVMPFLFVALPEELGKLWIVKKRAYDHHKFNEIMDGITYCVLASMGFAVFENILYTYNYGIEVGLLRAFTAVPAHALFSGLMGYYIGLAKFTKDKKKERRLLWAGLGVGVFFHGLYDFFLMSGINYLVLLVLPLLFYMATVLNRAIKKAHMGKHEKIAWF